MQFTHHTAQESKHFANTLKRKLTYAENLLWQQLRAGQLGVRFVKQHPKFGYILDFYSARLRLGIEVDGKYHGENKVYDRIRDNNLASRNIRIIRFTNEEVISNIENVLHIIKNAIRE